MSHIEVPTTMADITLIRFGAAGQHSIGTQTKSCLTAENCRIILENLAPNLIGLQKKLYFESSSFIKFRLSFSIYFAYANV